MPGAIPTETIVEDSDDATDLRARAGYASEDKWRRREREPLATAAVTLPPPPLPKRKPKAEPPASSAEIARSAPQPERPPRQEAPKQGQADRPSLSKGPPVPRRGRSVLKRRNRAKRDRPLPSKRRPKLAAAWESGCPWRLRLPTSRCPRRCRRRGRAVRPMPVKYGRLLPVISRGPGKRQRVGGLLHRPWRRLGGVRIGRSSGNRRSISLPLRPCAARTLPAAAFGYSFVLNSHRFPLGLALPSRRPKPRQAGSACGTVAWPPRGPPTSQDTLSPRDGGGLPFAGAWSPPFGAERSLIV